MKLVFLITAFFSTELFAAKTTLPIRCSNKAYSCVMQKTTKASTEDVSTTCIENSYYEATDGDITFQVHPNMISNDELYTYLVLKTVPAKRPAIPNELVELLTTNVRPMGSMKSPLLVGLKVGAVQYSMACTFPKAAIAAKLQPVPQNSIFWPIKSDDHEAQSCQSIFS